MLSNGNPHTSRDFVQALFKPSRAQNDPITNVTNKYDGKGKVIIPAEWLFRIQIMVFALL